MPFPTNWTAWCGQCCAGGRKTGSTASEVERRLEAIAQPPIFRRRTIWAAAAIGIGLLGGLTVWRGVPLLKPYKAVLLQSLPLDSEPASETAPSFSPDGNSVVYASDLGSPGIHHIMTRTVAGSSQPLTLTSASQDDLNPVWSRDGLHIAFLRRNTADLLHAIVIPAGGGVERVIAALPGVAAVGASFSYMGSRRQRAGGRAPIESRLRVAPVPAPAFR